MSQLALVRKIAMERRQNIQESVASSCLSNTPIEEQVALLDLSGSMGRYIGPNERAIDRLKQEFGDAKWKGMIVGFASDAEKMSSTRVQQVDLYSNELGHLTFVSKAVRLAHKLGAKAGVLITDGLPSDMSEALKAIRETGIKLDVIFIGPDDTTTPEFIKRLAEMGHGRASAVTLKRRGQLTQGIKGLLASPNKEAIRL